MMIGRRFEGARKRVSNYLLPGSLLVTALSLCSGCTIRDDSTRSNQLEGLRVLGISSEPADVVPGETISLAALVHEPEDRPVQYQWNWCLNRGGSAEGYECSVSEEELRAAWQELGIEAPFPEYDLGSGTEAELFFSFPVEEAIPLCEILNKDAPSPQEAIFLCLSELSLSIELIVTRDDEEVRALKDIPVALDPSERNQNPQIGPGLEVRGQDGELLEAGTALEKEQVYQLLANVDPREAESFIPAEEPGLPPPEARDESLFLSWMVTEGATHRDGDARTSYIFGGSFDSLVENSWAMPFSSSSTGARIYLVLRDERGGISWAKHDYDLREKP